MNIKITEQKENKLLSRTEVSAKMTFEGVTPARKTVQQDIAKQLKAKEPLVVVKQIITSYGTTVATVTAYVYSDEQVMMRLERKNLLEKHVGHESKAQGAEE